MQNLHANRYVYWNGLNTLFILREESGAALL